MLRLKDISENLLFLFKRLTLDFIIIGLAASFWYMSIRVDEYFISYLLKSASLCLILMLIWPALGWIAKKNKSDLLTKLNRFLAKLVKSIFYTVGAIKDIGIFFTIVLVFPFVVGLVFSLPFIVFSKLVFSIEQLLIVYLSISLAAIVFLEFGSRIFKFIENIFAPLIEVKPSRASIIETFRLLFTGKVFRISVYFYFFLYLIFYAVIDLSRITSISIAWLASIYNVKESVLHAFYTVLAYDAFRVNFINYEPQKPTL